MFKLGLEDISQLAQQTKEPFNISIMDVESFIADNNCLPITSHSIHQASSKEFHPEGLFSETIFNQLGSPERMTTFGYIKLNTRVFQPIVYKTICKLKQNYKGIIGGTIYAKFDDDIGDFIACSSDDPEGNTGYTFFNKHFSQVKLDGNNSPQRKSRIDLLNKYKDLWYTNKMLVLPAGVRDIKTDDSMLSQDDINKLYLAVLSYASKIPAGSTNPIYDGLRGAIIRKMEEVYDYIENILSGKKGFLRGNLSKRTVALGTRNVITATQLKESPGSPRFMRTDETIVPIYQIMKAFQPVVMFHLKRSAFEDIFTAGSTQVPLINKKTYKLEYKEISSTTAELYTTSQGLESLISQFKNYHNRDKPITVKDVDNKEHYLYLVYDTGDMISMFRNIDDLKRMYTDIDKSFIRPLTWLELFYMTTYNAIYGKHCFITRYPIGQGHDSCYPSKMRLISTKPNRMVTLQDPVNPMSKVVFPHYPVIGEQCVDSVSPSVSKLSGLAGDYDGDTISLDSVIAIDANKEIDDYLNSWASVITPQQDLYDSGNSSDQVAETIFNLSRIP